MGLFGRTPAADYRHGLTRVKRGSSTRSPPGLRWTGITARPRQEGVCKGILPVIEQILRAKRNRNILRFVRSMPCRACGGSRLRPEALAVRFGGRTIAQAAALPIADTTLCRLVARPRPGLESPGCGARRRAAGSRARLRRAPNSLRSYGEASP
jgi:hypothetical protein